MGGGGLFDIVPEILIIVIKLQEIVFINTIIERGRYSSQQKLGTVAGYKRS